MTGQDSRRLLARFSLEAGVLVLLVLTILSVRYHEPLFRKSITIEPETAGTFGTRAYGDEQLGGNSVAAVDPANPLAWSCELGNRYANYFCGFEIRFDQDGTGKGLDLSNYDHVHLNLSYDGPGEWIRFYVKNFDPRYSDVRIEDSTKFNIVEILDSPGRQEIRVALSDFNVAQWWLTDKKIPPELSQPQFENVVALDIQPGTGAQPGLHRFRLDSITFEGAMISSAQWYLCLLAFWVVAICCLLVHRLVHQRRDFREKQLLQEERNRDLQAAKAAAETASHAKSQFLANMSHELRTPLNAILGYAQLLQREDLTERQAKAAQTIHQSGGHLLTLITDVLDLAKIEAGKLELVEGSMDLKAALGAIADMIRVRAQEKDLAFAFDMPDDLPRFIVGDEKRLRQILINLLGNAVKFTTEGEVSLKVSQVGGSFTRPRLRFEIRDSGPGIEAELLPLIFQPFEQACDRHGRDSGTGLGLSISAQILALMGSRIQVDSSPGSGSRFWFELDVAPADCIEPFHRCPKGAFTGYAGPRRKLLIVDDRPENRAVLGAMVEQLGFDVAEACDGAESIDVAEREQPHLILMDMRMPVMDGFEAIGRLRSREATRDLPIIAVSASATSEFEARSLAAGADAFLAKPVDHEELVQLLVWHLQLDWTRTGAVAGAAERPDSGLVAPPADQMAVLHALALAGNMRAIRTQADQILAMDERYRPFAETLQTLASQFQSPDILRLIEQHSDSRQAA